MIKPHKSLKDVAQSPTYIIDEAKLIFNSYKKITLVVEGETDRDLLVPFFIGKPIRFTESKGKDKSLNMLDLLNQKSEVEKRGIYFLIDVDYDYLCSRIKEDSNLIYSFYCTDTKTFFFNDIETFLVNSQALTKLLVNLHPKDNVDINDCLRLLLPKLENFSREVGAIRAANEMLADKRTILDGVDLFEFISFNNSNLSNWNMSFDIENLRERLSSCSPRKSDIDDLFEKAYELKQTEPKWRLSRGHDVTEILKDFFLHHTKKYLLKEDRSGKKYASDIEVLLRIAAEEEEFLKTNVGTKILQLLHNV